MTGYDTLGMTHWVNKLALELEGVPRASVHLLLYSAEIIHLWSVYEDPYHGKYMKYLS